MTNRQFRLVLFALGILGAVAAFNGCAWGGLL